LSSLDRLESLPSEFRGVEEEEEEFSFSVGEALRPVLEYLLVDEAGRGLLVTFWRELSRTAGSDPLRGMRWTVSGSAGISGLAAGLALGVG
jgi:hypothetical protein